MNNANSAISSRIPPLPESLTLTPPAIMATLGPTFETLEQIVEATGNGCRWFRLPFGYRERDHIANARTVYEARLCTNTQSFLVADLPSGRPRLAASVEMAVRPGDNITFSNVALSSDELSVMGLSSVLEFLRCGHRILLLDGRVSLKIISISDNSISAVCKSGCGTIKRGNSLSFPDSNICYPPVLPEDLRILEALAASETPVDWVLLSMVSSSMDIANAKVRLSSLLPQPKFLAKIETAQAVEDISAILDIADGILIGRGDLGLALPWDELPINQAFLVKMARDTGKPVFVATQSLEAFAESGLPQRSELTDVATVSWQRATGLMLGKETVYSKHPMESIALASRIMTKSQLPSGSWLHYSKPKREKKIIAVEGPNGSGKTTLCKIMEKHSGMTCMRGVPAEWEYPPLKTRVLNSESWMTSVMYFLAGSLALAEDISSRSRTILDRCVWSTLAIQAAADPERIPEMFRILDFVASQLVFPDLTIVLDAQYSVCVNRIKQKSTLERNWDAAAPGGEVAHRREMDFFRWLAAAGVPVIFIDANIAPEQIAKEVYGVLESC